MNNVRPLEWDSDFFGFKIGRADISTDEAGLSLVDIKQNLQSRFELLYVFGNSDVSFHESNANLIDRKVVFSLDNPPCCETNENVMIWPTQFGLTEELLELALESGKYSRFRLDDRFPKGSYERLYTCWIEKSVNHSIATEVFCYMIEGKPRGLVTIDIKEGIGIIGLVAMHKSFQHRGIGTSLMRHVIHYAHEKQCEKLLVATQLDNEPACHLYKKCGMVIDSITKIWHWWL